jgi:hypothetical protein
MGAGEIILVAYSQENLFLTFDPQITLFKILYRRYSNFAIETIKQTFSNASLKFGNKYSLEISKNADLLHKMWLVIELPNIPIIYDLNNNADSKLKFKWAKEIGYSVIDYVEIEIEGKTITKHWGEFYSCLNELNSNDFNNPIDEYIGNVPELTTYKHTTDEIPSYTLNIPLNFWFCLNSGKTLPLIKLEFSKIKFNVQFKNLESCCVFSPSNYISLESYKGNGIIGEPLLQISQQGYSWGEFDSLEINSFNDKTMNIDSYNLYYRKISDNDFITSLELNTIKFSDALNSAQKYVIYGLTSGSIYIPSSANSNDANTTLSSKKYFYNFDYNMAFKDVYVLCDFIYIDNDERVKFYNSKRNYLIDQVYQTSIVNINNLSSKNHLDTINCCKYLIFLSQVKYFTNNNVNFNFNYNTLFFNPEIINSRFTFFNFINKNTIQKANFSYDSSSSEEMLDMDIYSLINTFYGFKRATNNSGFGLKTFALYTENSQPSGSTNTSAFNSFELNTRFNKIDNNYNKYLFRTYCVTYNYLTFTNGISGTLFTDAY